MAVDIGPKIGIDGEAEFRKQINTLTQQVKTFGSEMKALTSDVDYNEDSIESLTRKNNVLLKSIDAQEQKLKGLQEGLQKAEKAFGKTDSRTLRWQQAVNNATTDLNKMQAELRQTDQRMDDLANGTDKAADSFDDAGQSALSFGDILGANLISDAISSALSGIVDGLKNVVEESREYRKIMGSLEVSSQKAGYSTEQTADTYKTLYGVLADNQTAATTTANLQALGLEQEQLAQITQGAIGAWATYGDSIPIDGLAESINETVQAGQVTGTFADVLNWAGTSEDDFNDKLANCSDASERANLVLQEMANQGLMQAGEAWQTQNESLVAANQATADYEAKIAELGEIVEPVFTAMQEALNLILGIVLQLLESVNFEAIAAGISSIMEYFTGLVTGVQSGSITLQEAFAILQQDASTLLTQFVTETLPQLTTEFTGMLTTLLQTAGETAPQMIQQGTELAINLVNGIVQGLPKMISAAGQLISEFLNTVMQTFPQILESGGQILSSLVQGIASNFPEIATSAVEAIGGFVTGIISNLPQILESGIKLLGELIAGIISAIPDLILAIPQVISAIWDTITNTNWIELGGNIIKGLANGILGLVGSVVDAAKEAAGKIANAFKDFFNINSPSKWAEEEIAGNIMKGFPVGFKKYTAKILPTIEDVSGKIAQAFPAKIEVPIEANGTALAYDRMTAQLMDLQVVLEDGTLVGKLAPRLNNTLGGYARREGRFGV